MLSSHFVDQKIGAQIGRVTCEDNESTKRWGHGSKPGASEAKPITLGLCLPFKKVIDCGRRGPCKASNLFPMPPGDSESAG